MSKQIIEISRCGSNKKWIVKFDNEIPAHYLYGKTIEVKAISIDIHDPNEFTDKRTAIIRIHWLPSALSDYDVIKFLTQKINSSSFKILDCSKEGYKDEDMTSIRNGVRIVKVQIPIEKFENLIRLIG
jgi:hypothetical protein